MSRKTALKRAFLLFLRPNVNIWELPVKALIQKGWFILFFAIVISVLNGVIVAIISSSFFMEEVGNSLLRGILAASASYIAVLQQ